MHRPHLRTLTTALIALTLPVTLLVGVTTAAYFKSTNPDNVDISQGLAYLQYTIIASVVAFALFLIASVIGIVQMYRRDHDFHNAKFPMILLTSILVLLVGIVAVNAYTSKVEDTYLIDNGRPTLQQFFDELEKQKSN